VPQARLADRLHSAAIHLLRQVASVDARSGLSAARLSALSVVVYRGPLTMSELARAEQVSNATITSTVTGLEAAGLVRRTRPAGDGRSVRVEATGAGRQLLTTAREARLAVLEESLARLSAADRAALEAAVDALERLTHPPC
jgi:DNA-binding MarR family transcriptional regulator